MQSKYLLQRVANGRYASRRLAVAGRQAGRRVDACVHEDCWHTRLFVWRNSRHRSCGGMLVFGELCVYWFRWFAKETSDERARAVHTHCKVRDYLECCALLRWLGAHKVICLRMIILRNGNS